MNSEKESIESILSRKGLKISLRCPRVRELSSGMGHRSAAGSGHAQYAVEEDRDVQFVVKNIKTFDSLLLAHPLSAVTDIHDFYHFLLIRKISKIQKLVRNQKDSESLNKSKDKSANVYNLNGNDPAIKYITEHKEDIFSEAQTDCDLKYAALDSIIDFQGGIKKCVFTYLCQECPFMIIERFDNLKGIFDQSVKTDKPEEDLFSILFHSVLHLPGDVPSDQKLIDSLLFQTVLDIWKNEYSKNNRHRQLIDQYIGELCSYAELLCSNLSKDNVYERENAVKSLSSFLNQVKIYKSDVLSEYVTKVERLKRAILVGKADLVQKFFVHVGAEDWRCLQGCKPKLFLLTHFELNSVQYSFLSKKLESLEDKPYNDMPDDEFFTLECRKRLSNLEADQDAEFLEILRDRRAFEVYSWLVKYAALYISSKISKQNDGLVVDVEMMLVMLRLAYRDFNKNSQEQEIFCYSLSMFLCSISEKILRLFNFYLTKGKDSENATLGDLLNEGQKELVKVLGIDHIRTLAYFLIGTTGIKLGRNYRNSLVHWSSGLVPSDMSPVFASSMLWMFTDILNSVSIYFDKQTAVSRSLCGHT